MKPLILSILIVSVLLLAACSTEIEPTPTTTTESAVFYTSNLTIEPAEVAPNETVTISVSITNTGGGQGSHDVVLVINDEEEEIKSVTLAAGDSEDVTFSVTRGDAGIHRVRIEWFERDYDATISLYDSFTVMLPVSIKIEAIASTWRDGEEPYDIYSEIEAKLANVGFKVVSEVGEPYDALLSVEYEESFGGAYTRGGSGTNIRCNLKLFDNIGNLLFENEIYASSPDSVVLREGKSLYDNTLQIFEGTFYFKNLGEVIATKLGFGNLEMP